MQLSDINGIYNLGPKEINGYPHWIHENGKQAMWFNKISASWFVGDTEDVGDNMGGISGKILFIPIFSCLFTISALMLFLTFRS